MGKHTYQISVDEENHLVLLIVKGELNKEEGEQVIKETRAKAAETGLDILCDISQAKITVRLADWFYLLRNPDIFPTTPDEKTAILAPQKERFSYNFVENVARNLGMNIRVFYLDAEAKEWLKETS